MNRDHPGPGVARRRTPAAPCALALALAALLAGLAACTPAPRATPAATNTPRTGLVAVAAQAATATQPPTATPRPSSTAEPSATPTPTATATPASPYAHATDVNPLTGQKAGDPATLARRPLFVVISNSPAARAVQSGLAEADLVYEYMMEGRGTTRFTAVYLGSEAPRIRPMRSARLVNLYLTPQYGGGLAASGANGQINWFLTFKMGVPYLNTDINDPNNLLYSTSIGSLADYETRMQTSTTRLRKWLADVKGETDPGLRGFAFAETKPGGEAAIQAMIAYPAVVTWQYEAGSGRYLRTMAGTPHKDAGAGKQIGAANVIIQTVPHEATTYVEDTLGDTSIRIITVGEGPVTVLRDGVAISGTWRAGETSMPEFLDKSGRPIALKPGNTWFELVAAGDKVTLK